MVTFLTTSRAVKVVLTVVAAMVLVMAFALATPDPAVGPTQTIDVTASDRELLRVLPPSSLPRAREPMASSEAALPDGIFVSSALGSSDNDGLSLQTPVRSLQDALNRVQPGETVYVMDGTYTEVAAPGDHHYLVAAGGRPDAWVRVANAPGHAPVIVASRGNGLEIQADYVEIEGLTIRGDGFDEGGDPWGAGILVRGSHDVRIVDNEISSMPVSGVSSVESTKLTIMNNEIYENSFWSTVQGSGISLWRSVAHDQGPDVDGYHDRIIGNRIYRNENRVRSRWRNFEVITDGNGIIIDETRQTGYPGRVLVANNLIFDNGGRAIMVFKSSNVDVVHNTTYHNGRTAELDGGPVELAAGHADGVRFVNNLVWPRPDAPGLRVFDAYNVTSGGNLIVGAGSGDHSDSDRVTSEDPRLVNPTTDTATADFRPQPTSPAVGMAVAVEPSLTFDMVGRPREAGRWTVGAYEGG